MAKDILISITGTTPQVITETLYGIYRNNYKRMPKEIHVITTVKGEEILNEKLLGKGGKLEQFYLDYNLQPIDQEKSVFIHIIADPDGRQITDARSKEDQRIIADFIYNVIRKLTDCTDKDAMPMYRIHASIAGGRKTMTYLLGSAMNILGNTEDLLTHVLVSQEFENVNDFYYPTLDQYMVQNREGEFLDARNAEIELSEIPLIRLRSILQNNSSFNFMDSYNDTVNNINYALSIKPENLKLQLVTAECKLIIDDTYEIVLSPMLFAIYRMYLENVKHEGKYEKPTKQGFSAQRQRIIKMYLTIFKYIPIVNEKLRYTLSKIIQEQQESYEKEKNYNFLVTIVEKTNLYLQEDQDNRGVKRTNFETASDCADDKTFNLLHPKLEYSNSVIQDNESFVGTHFEFWNNRFKDIAKKISKTVKCTELAEHYKIKPVKGNYKIGIPLKNIIIDGKPFIDMKDD